MTRHHDTGPDSEVVSLGPEKHPNYARLWAALAIVVLGSFAILGYWGTELYRKAPPVPERVVTFDGRTLFNHHRHP